MFVLVTGASGCIGRAVLRRLAADSHRVRGVARGPAPQDLPYAEWVRGDLGALPADDLLGGCDAVVHLAALVHCRKAQPERAYFEQNAAVTRRLVRAASTRALEPRRFVYASTVAVYGRDHDLCADEATPVMPKTPYARAKYDGERSVAELGGTVLRFPMVYGSGDRGNLARLARAIFARRFVRPSRAENLRSFLGSRNAAEAVALALRADRPGDVYLVTDGADLTLAELVDLVALGVGRPPPPSVPASLLLGAATLGSVLRRVGLPAPLTREEWFKLTGTLRFSSEKAKAALDYRPVETPEAGVPAAARAAIVELRSEPC